MRMAQPSALLLHVAGSKLSVLHIVADLAHTNMHMSGTFIIYPKHRAPSQLFHECVAHVKYDIHALGPLSASLCVEGIMSQYELNLSQMVGYDGLQCVVQSM